MWCPGPREIWTTPSGISCMWTRLKQSWKPRHTPGTVQTVNDKGIVSQVEYFFIDFWKLNQFFLYVVAAGFQHFFIASVICMLWYLIVFQVFDPYFCNISKNPSSNPPQRLRRRQLTLKTLIGIRQWYPMVGEIPTVRSSETNTDLPIVSADFFTNFISDIIACLSYK